MFSECHCRRCQRQKSGRTCEPRSVNNVCGILTRVGLLKINSHFMRSSSKISTNKLKSWSGQPIDFWKAILYHLNELGLCEVHCYLKVALTHCLLADLVNQGQSNGQQINRTQVRIQLATWVLVSFLILRFMQKITLVLGISFPLF